MTTKNITITLSRDGYTTIAWVASELYSFVYFDAEMVSDLNPGVTTFRAKVDPRQHIQVNDNSTNEDPGPIDPVPARYAVITWDALDPESNPDVVGYRVYLDGKLVATRTPNAESYTYKTDWLESGAHTLDVYSLDDADNISQMQSLPFDIASEPNHIQCLTITNGSAGGNINIDIVAPEGI